MTKPLRKVFGLQGIWLERISIKVFTTFPKKLCAKRTVYKRTKKLLWHLSLEYLGYKPSVWEGKAKQIMFSFNLFLATTSTVKYDSITF